MVNGGWWLFFFSAEFGWFSRLRNHDTLLRSALHLSDEAQTFVQPAWTFQSISPMRILEEGSLMVSEELQFF